MAESTICKTLQDATIQFAALGGGAYNTTTGALIGAAKTYTVSFESGDVSITYPSRAVNNFKDRNRRRSAMAQTQRAASRLRVTSAMPLILRWRP